MNKLADRSNLHEYRTIAMHRLAALAAAPDYHRVLFENERVRVLDTRLPAGEQTPVHAHESPAALYVLSWSDFIRRDANGNVLADNRGRPSPAIGEGLWIDACARIRLRIPARQTCTSSASR